MDATTSPRAQHEAVAAPAEGVVALAVEQEDAAVGAQRGADGAALRLLGSHPPGVDRGDRVERRRAEGPHQGAGVPPAGAGAGEERRGGGRVLEAQRDVAEVRERGLAERAAVRERDRSEPNDVAALQARHAEHLAAEEARRADGGALVDRQLAPRSHLHDDDARPARRGVGEGQREERAVGAQGAVVHGAREGARVGAVGEEPVGQAGRRG